MGILDWFGRKKAEPQPPMPKLVIAPAPSVTSTFIQAPAPSATALPRARPPRPEPTPQDLESARRKLAPHARRCLKPQVKSGDGTATSSHFCGNAALRAGEPWPACGECGAPMQLFIQLNSIALPPESGAVFGDGILQLFYCTAGNCDGGYEAFSAGHLGRILTRNDRPVLGRNPDPESFKTKVIVGWDVLADYPHSEETAGLGVALTPLEERAFYEQDDERYPASGDKLLGWPDWVQGVEYIDCPDCGKPMRYIFQIDSENNVPYMFGDSGVGHISICPQHPNRISFQWACC